MEEMMVQQALLSLEEQQALVLFGAQPPEMVRELQTSPIYQLELTLLQLQNLTMAVRQ